MYKVPQKCTERKNAWVNVLTVTCCSYNTPVDIHHVSVVPTRHRPWEEPDAGVPPPGQVPDQPSARGDRPQLQRGRHRLQEEVPGRRPPHLSRLQPAAQTARHQGEAVWWCHHQRSNGSCCSDVKTYRWSASVNDPSCALVVLTNLHVCLLPFISDCCQEVLQLRHPRSVHGRVAIPQQRLRERRVQTDVSGRHRDREGLLHRGQPEEMKTRLSVF